MSARGFRRLQVYGLIAAVFLFAWPAAGQLPDDLVGWWKLDEGAGSITADASGNGNDGTLQGDPQWAPGVYGGAIELDGAGDYVDCGAGDPLNLTEQVTIACWMKVRTFTKAWQTIVGKGNNYQLERNDVANVVNFYIGNPGRRTGPGVTPVDDGEWHHVAGTYEGSAMRLYVDGVLDKEAPVTGPIFIDADPVYMGESPQWPNRHFDGWIDDVQIYSRALALEEIVTIMAGAGVEKAKQPNPPDNAEDVSRDCILGWAPGDFAVAHDVYLGTAFEDVNDADRSNPLQVLVSEALDTNSYDPIRLEFGQTYYWRADEVNDVPDATIFRGDVWKFTVEPFSYAIPTEAVSVTASSSAANQPAINTVNRSGLNENDEHSDRQEHMWFCDAADLNPSIQFEFDRLRKLDKVHVWNHNTQTEAFLGFGINEALIETSVDGSNWVAFGTVTFKQATGKLDYTGDVVALDGIVARMLRITGRSNYSLLGLTQRGLAEVRFFAVPVYAWEPQPADGATVQGVDVTLGWRSGREADVHEVLLSDDLSAVEDGSAIVATPSEAAFTPPTLAYNTIYYWQIVEVNETETPARYEGDLWNFTTPPYLAIDDFESYQDKEGAWIYEFWIDGYEDNTNGSVVGNGNEAETAIAYEGSQSMPLHYDNSGVAYSEVTRSFDPPLNWSLGEPTTLSLHVRGHAPAFVEGSDDTLVVGASGRDIWDVADDFRFVYKQLSGDGSITARIDSVEEANAWTKGGIMMRENLSAESTNAFAFVTPSGRAGVQWRVNPFETTVATQSQNEGDITLPFWVKLTRTGHLFKGERSADGIAWEPMFRQDRPEDPAEMEVRMIPDVYIGLAVTSHDIQASTVAVYSHLSTTGSVSGSWQVEAIGGEHLSSDAAPMYVRVVDGSGREKSIAHPDPALTNQTTWEHWGIPLSDLNPVNSADIASLTIGVGNPGGSPTGASGTVYIDLIQVGTPPAAEEPDGID